MDVPLSWLQSYLKAEASSSRWASTNHMPPKSPQGSVLGPVLFAVYCSPIVDVIAHYGVQCHQYADDMQLRLAMCAKNTPAGLSVLSECITDVRQWYLRNGLQFWGPE